MERLCSIGNNWVGCFQGSDYDELQDMIRIGDACIADSCLSNSFHRDVTSVAWASPNKKNELILHCKQYVEE